MKTLGDFKPGDTFGFCAIVTDESGEPVTLDAENIKSQVRDYKLELLLYSFLIPFIFFLSPFFNFIYLSRLALSFFSKT